MRDDYVIREATPEIGEGPYYKAGSPRRNNIVEKADSGENLTVEGKVLDTRGNPIRGAWLDFWQANGIGEYDNIGYNLRGHQLTDEKGMYRLETVMPAMYGTRTPHIHVKLQANNQAPKLTSQLFFPYQARNQTDPIFNPKTVVTLAGSPGDKLAAFDFVLEV